jgi:hypothetical protein
MFPTLLFIAIIISSNMFIKGFLNLNRFSIKKTMRLNVMRLNVMRLNLKLTTTCFDDDDDWNNKRKQKYNYNDGSNSNFNNQIHQEQNYINNIYTLVWYDCDECKELLTHIKNNRKNISYINGSYYFFDVNDKTNTPLFYKNDELIATDVFSIYEELFYNKINEE